MATTGKSNTMERHYGILTRTDWNTNKWQDIPTDEDLKMGSNNTDNSAIHSSLNFAHSDAEEHKTTVHQGYLYQLKDPIPKPEDLKFVQIIFTYSKDIETQKDYLTGFFAFPAFPPGQKASPYPEFPHLKSNVRAVSGNVHRLDNYLDMEVLDKQLFSTYKNPKGKRKYVYLTKGQVEKILDALTIVNPEDKKLHGIKFKILKSML